MGCKVAGAARIIAVDIYLDKFEKAEAFGATEFVNPKDHSKPIQEVLVEMTGGGVDFALECVGNVTVMVGVQESCLESCKDAWGVCVVVGWTEVGEISLFPQDLLVGRTLKGTYFGGELTM
ncbi:unnamed protein product [Coregonus sp. 'balchen']|nr:unnamed protein product [Coregonus sp. 'balchen']